MLQSGGHFSVMVLQSEVNKAQEIWTWGCNNEGQLGIGQQECQTTPQRVVALEGKHVQSIACGHEHMFAVCVTDGRPQEVC